MTLITASETAFVPNPRSPPIDEIPIMLTVHLLGLVTGTAMIIGLIPAAILLLRALL